MSKFITWLCERMFDTSMIASMRASMRAPQHMGLIRTRPLVHPQVLAYTDMGYRLEFGDEDDEEKLRIQDTWQSDVLPMPIIPDFVHNSEHAMQSHSAMSYGYVASNNGGYSNVASDPSTATAATSLPASASAAASSSKRAFEGHASAKAADDEVELEGEGAVGPGWVEQPALNKVGHHMCMRARSADILSANLVFPDRPRCG
jgi:hypothetical protein